jgi:hypothetical protein
MTKGFTSNSLERDEDLATAQVQPVIETGGGRKSVRTKRGFRRECPLSAQLYAAIRDSVSSLRKVRLCVRRLRKLV